MSLSSNTAQTRELSELRNHLKWLDEERRKSGRKMTELEQRLAQQGRELAERDQKIQELEWHVANFAERFERMPDLDTNVAGTEQRLQDLEWHLSNMNTQLARLPNPEEERARRDEEIAQAITTFQERLEGGQAELETRLRSEIITLRDSNELRVLLSNQQDQAQAINEMDQQFAALQESVGILSGQLRERTMTLAAESQSNLSSLAARFQEHLDAMTSENQSRIAGFEAEWQEKFDALPTPSSDPSPDLLRLDEQLTEVSQSQQQWALRWAQLEQQIGEQLEQRMGEINETIAPLTARQSELGLVAERLPDIQAELTSLREQSSMLESRLAQQIRELNENLAPLNARQSELSTMTERLPNVEAELTSLTERLPNVEAELMSLTERLPNVEAELASWSERLPNVEAELTSFQEQSSVLGDQLARLARQQAQTEDSIAKIGNVREIMPLLDHLEQEIELRQAEEVRLSNLISTQETRFAPLAAALEEIQESNSDLLGRVSDSERLLEELRTSVQDFNDNWKPAMTEINQRLAPMTERMTSISNNVLKNEAALQALTGDQSELREMVTDLGNENQRSQSNIARQLEGWQATLDENKDTIERFTQQWITLSNQYKEARMAVQNFAHWQKQLEQQKREASEMLRVESNRMQSRWDGFLMEIQEKLKNFELDLGQKWQAFELENEQKWSGARRGEQLWREELSAVDELIQKLQQDNRNLIWRVQNAQADAIKKWPRLLMEEVEKAVELNPNRRLSSAGMAPRAEMSVVDAIEQGLITIDYSDESAVDI